MHRADATGCIVSSDEMRHDGEVADDPVVVIDGDKGPRSVTGCAAGVLVEPFVEQDVSRAELTEIV